MINGKNNINYDRLHTKNYGKARREELALNIFENQAYIPKTINYRDIDVAFKKWVENDLDISFDGKQLPTMFLVATQRLNEFGQNWKFNKEGGLLLNFKTITRETNPEKGTIYGGSYNIPGNIYFNVGRIPVIENNIESFDLIEMKQPLQVDITYTVSLFSTNFSLLNDFNRLIQDKFKAIECYLKVNEHYISMELENVTDNSQYDLENRKFYSQSFQILVKAYIITENDFRRTRCQTRMMLAINTDVRKKPLVTIEDDEINQYQSVNLSINFHIGSKNSAKFRLDEDILVKLVDTHNIKSFTMRRDNEDFNVPICGHFSLKKYEKISINIKRMDENMDALIQFKGENINYKPEP